MPRVACLAELSRLPLGSWVRYLSCLITAACGIHSTATVCLLGLVQLGLLGGQNLLLLPQNLGIVLVLH